jgi:hypothetical protein
MRVQHVWAKTGTSPVTFHNTTRDVALCPASGRRPVRVFRQDQRPQCGHIERARPTLAPPHSPGPPGNDTPGRPSPACVPAVRREQPQPSQASQNHQQISRKSRSCSIVVTSPRLKASSCSKWGALRPERPTLTPCLVLPVARGAGDDVVPEPGRRSARKLTLETTTPLIGQERRLHSATHPKSQSQSQSQDQSQTVPAPLRAG